MSEAGKVSLPTPKRIEEIKRLHAAASPGPWTYDETVGDVFAEKADEIICSDVHNAPFIAAAITIVPELLAALEEAQQQNDEIKMKSHSKIYTQSVQIKTGLERIETLFNELVEAQQTIARQREALEEIRSEGAYAGNNKYYHIASAALGEGAKES